MIHITVKKTSDDYQVTVKGHAGYNPGNDIVCSAVSALTWVLVHTAASLEPGLFEVKMDAGDASVCVSPGRDKKVVFRVFDEIVSGFLAISEEYPENVKVHG